MDNYKINPKEIRSPKEIRGPKEIRSPKEIRGPAVFGFGTSSSFPLF